MEILRKIGWWVLNKLARANKYYDGLEEPKRFFGMLIVISPWIFLDLFGLIIDHKGFDIFGIIWILMLIGLRMWWVEGNLKHYLEPPLF